MSIIIDCKIITIQNLRKSRVFNTAISTEGFNTIYIPAFNGHLHFMYEINHGKAQMLKQINIHKRDGLFENRQKLLILNANICP